MIFARSLKELKARLEVVPKENWDRGLAKLGKEYLALAAATATELGCPLKWPLFDVAEQLKIDPALSAEDEAWLDVHADARTPFLRSVVRFAYRAYLAAETGKALKEGQLHLYDPLLSAYAQGAVVTGDHG